VARRAVQPTDPASDGAARLQRRLQRRFEFLRSGKDDVDVDPVEQASCRHAGMRAPGDDLRHHGASPTGGDLRQGGYRALRNVLALRPEAERLVQAPRSGRTAAGSRGA
jgi:hypothetical protein